MTDLALVVLELDGALIRLLTIDGMPIRGVRHAEVVFDIKEPPLLVLEVYCSPTIHDIRDLPFGPTPFGP